ncbi:MAG: hypothetical protein ACRD1C_13885 [Terriglobales bacterium]
MLPPSRPDPDHLLRQILAQEEHERRGLLKIFLGYSSGVGKSFRMLDEARRRRMRGQDVVVAATQANHAPEVEAVLAQLEVVPLRAGALDVATLLRRQPGLCVIDGLAYANPPGSERAQRWQDVDVLLANGIGVLATVNLQFIAELRAEVERISGRIRAGHDAVPEAFLRGAAEIEVVDAPPDSSSAAAGETGQQDRLAALRELTLLLTADVVEQQLDAYLRRHGLEPSWGAQERILVCLGWDDAEPMLASGRRNADRFHGELLALHVARRKQPPQAVEANLARARAHGADVHVLTGAGLVDGVLEFARSHRITQIYIGHGAHESWRSRLTGSPVEHLVRRAEGIDIRVFPHLRESGGDHG